MTKDDLIEFLKDNLFIKVILQTKDEDDTLSSVEVELYLNEEMFAFSKDWI